MKYDKIPQNTSDKLQVIACINSLNHSRNMPVVRLSKSDTSIPENNQNQANHFTFLNTK